MKRLTPLFLLALLALPLHAQEPQKFGEKIDVNIVLLDAIVTDPHGNQILGLAKDDFVVRENGTAQKSTLSSTSRIERCSLARRAGGVQGGARQRGPLLRILLRQAAGRRRIQGRVARGPRRRSSSNSFVPAITSPWRATMSA